MLFDRFLPTLGWLQIFLLGIYSAFIAEKLLDKKQTAKWRKRIWMLFSLVFFLQLILGIVGYEIFLLTGKLHIPVPAIILMGPLYRWELSFMVFLFLASIVLVGPAWCSYLCYFGIWDNLAATSRKVPSKVTYNVWFIRGGIFLLVIISSITMNLLGISYITAAFGGILFGLTGIVVIIFFSRKSGNMIHCTMYCPIGLLAVVLGKISPFRIKISDSCTDCMKCHLACRFNALNPIDIRSRKPNINCTLCGDCLAVCEHSSINYRFLNIDPELSRILFVIIISTVHSVFLGLGRI